MPAKILVTNTAGSKLGEIVGIVNSEHEFSKNESLDSWLKESPLNTKENWPRKFSIIKVQDKERFDLNDLLDGSYYFVAPEQGSDIWLEMYNTGGIDTTWDIVETFLRRSN